MADYPADSPANPPVSTSVPTSAHTFSPRAIRRNGGQFQDQLSEEYTIDTPENVTVGYAVAGIGSRFIGALIDSLFIVVLLLLVNFVLFASLSADDGLPFGMSEWDEGDIVAL